MGCFVSTLDHGETSATVIDSGASKSGSSSHNKSSFQTAGTSQTSDKFVSADSSSTNLSANDSASASAVPNPANLVPSSLRQFTFAGLESATSKFHRRNCIGEGGFGVVYRGVLQPGPNGLGAEPTEVAIKRMREASDRYTEEFLKEVIVLGRLSHPHLVRLHGYCMERDEALLVYEFMTGGCLHRALSDSASGELFFSWNMRLKVAVQVAEALAYMHGLNFIHRDLKAANVLLSPDYDAKLTDFGMVRVGPEGQLESIVSTRIMGTEGYIDPTYMETALLGVFPVELYSYPCSLSRPFPTLPLSPSSVPLSILCSSLHPLFLSPSSVPLSILCSSLHPLFLSPSSVPLSILCSSLHPLFLSPSSVPLSILCSSLHPLFLSPSSVPLSVLCSSLRPLFLSPSSVPLSVLCSSLHPLFLSPSSVPLSILCYSGHLGAKSDVYSFGVLLLELVTGRRVVDEGSKMVTECRSRLSDLSLKAAEYVDPHLGNQYPELGARTLATLARHCVAEARSSRPDIGSVLEKLKLLVKACANAEAKAAAKAAVLEAGESGSVERGDTEVNGGEEGSSAAVAPVLVDG
ncbi:unnamed protein product [Closterium sp. NIES-65]|nr:unnamed protein product [Closterium sp. NIES-65]